MYVINIVIFIYFSIELLKLLLHYKHTNNYHKFVVNLRQILLLIVHNTLNIYQL